MIVNIRTLIQNEYFKWRCTSCQIKQNCSDRERRHYSIVGFEGKEKKNEKENANEDFDLILFVSFSLPLYGRIWNSTEESSLWACSVHILFYF